MKHTPTPWMYTGNIDPNYIQKTQLVLQTKHTNSANIAKIIPCVGMTAEEVEANAERIVECVNACAGIENPDEIIKRGKAYIDQDKQIRALINADENESTFDEVERLKIKRDQLQRWKNEMLLVNKPLFEYDHKEMKVGESRVEFLLRMAKQRDDLLKLLKELVHAVKFRTQMSSATIHELIEAEKAITKVKGGKA